jgi:ribosome-associated translation inhibitor RaiA
MQVPLQIKFRFMEPTAFLEARVREQCHKLQRFAEYVTSCRVIIDAEHGQHKKDKLYRVIIDITLPGEEIITSHYPAQDQAHENVNVAIRDAFDAARHQLEDYVRRRRANMKLQDSKLHRQTA